MIYFLKYKAIYFIVSSIVIAFGLFSILRWGYRYSIDFVGGTNLEYQFTKAISRQTVETVIKKNNLEVESMRFDNNHLTLRTKALEENKENAFKTSLAQASDGKLVVLRSETVGPVLGKETMNKTLIAAALAILGILIYMSYAFRNVNFALAAILAMVHDFLVVIGSYSLFSHFFGAEVDTLFITAVLTTMSFSVHDTIIIFDKIREYIRNEGKGNIEYYSNKALTETLVRSLNNSMTIIFMLLSLTLMGGSTIRFFVATLLIGTITGTYSSPFIATPILDWLEKKKTK